MDFFKSEDFYFIDEVIGEAARLEICKVANRLLQERGVRMFGNPSGWTSMRWDKDSHKALVVCIEELPKKPCEHEPEWMGAYKTKNGFSHAHYDFCKHCGVKLKAVWEVSE